MEKIKVQIDGEEVEATPLTAEEVASLEAQGISGTCNIGVQICHTDNYFYVCRENYNTGQGYWYKTRVRCNEH